MRIVIASDYFGHIRGGSVKVAISSALGLCARGYHVTIVNGGKTADPLLAPSENLEIVNLDLTPFWKLTRTRKLAELNGNPKGAEGIAEVLKRFPVEETVVHFHDVNSVLTPSAVTQAIQMGFETVMTCHDYSAACPTSLFYNERTHAPCGHKALSAGCLTCMCTSKLTSKYAEAARRLGSRWFHNYPKALRHVIYLSELSLGALRPYFHEACTFHYLSNPQDFGNWDRADCGSHENFVFVGRLTPEKGGSLLARAARLAGVPIVFCGDGPERKAVLMDNPEAEVTGWSTPEQVHDQLHRARAFVIPSLWYECAPLSTYEAQSHGLPVICSDACASRGQVTSGVNGYLFKSNDTEDLASKLRSLAEDDDLVTEMSRRAYDGFWRKPPTLDAHIDGLVEIYNNLLHHV